MWRGHQTRRNFGGCGRDRLVSLRFFPVAGAGSADISAVAEENRYGVRGELQAGSSRRGGQIRRCDAAMLIMYSSGLWCLLVRLLLE
jgi:hypothetical protein